MVSLKTREKTLLVVMGVALCFFVTNKFVCAKKPTAKAMSKKSLAQESVEKPDKPVRAAVASSPTSAAEKTPVVLAALPDFWGRDPFLGANRGVQSDSTQKDSTALSLKGIAWKNGKAYAIIGNYILAPGERQGFLEVLEIKDDRVVCRQWGSIVTFVLNRNP